MKNIFILLPCIILMALGCGTNREETVNKATQSASQVSGAGCDTIVLKPTLPGDVKIINQQCANTFAWQNFISVTWPSSPDHAGQPDTTKSVKDWGTPGDFTPTTFGTYKSSEDVFSSSIPSPWGNDLALLMSNNFDTDNCPRSIFRLNKFDDPDIVNEVLQASGGTPWLTDQEGNLIWYEKKLNEVEFDYIVQNELYDSLKQLSVWENGAGIWLPNGSIEIKAAWREIPQDQLDTLQYRYKIIQACVPDTVFIENKKVVVSGSVVKYLGLIGLHIIHKTSTTPQFIWATFEHVDLAPNSISCEPSATDWLLYNPDSCEVPPNVSPSPEKDEIYNPIQVVKERADAPDGYATGLNEFVVQRIIDQNPNSVFQYYRLVGTQWPSSAVADKDNKKYTPLLDGGKTPYVLTNVSMETYVQGLSCLTCHVGAGIKIKSKKEFASDYSFLFQEAKR